MFRLDNGSELFSSQDMQRLRKLAGGAMGSRPWVESTGRKEAHSSNCSGNGTCSCVVKCANCRCTTYSATEEKKLMEASHESSSE